MNDSLPVTGWERDQACYGLLIRPVVAYIRDNGPDVPSTRVAHFIASTATGDLRFASPTRDREDAAHRALNFFVEDIDAISADPSGAVTVPAGVTSVTSTALGERKVPSGDDLLQQREDSRLRRALREWVSRDLFRTKWRDGVRKHKDADVLWMAEQIEAYGYTGPRIVKDADTGAIIDGALRAAALGMLGIPSDDYTETRHFRDDLHRLRYVLAANTVPNGHRFPTRVPRALRDAVLREVVPYGSSICRGAGGSFVEPSTEEWVMIAGSGAIEDSAPVEDSEPSVEVAVGQGDGMTEKDRIIDVLLSSGTTGWVTSNDVIDLLRSRHGHTNSNTDRNMRSLAEEGKLERRKNGAAAEFRLPPTDTPSGKSRTKYPDPGKGLKTTKHHAVAVLLSKKGEWIDGKALDEQVTHNMKHSNRGGKRKTASYDLRKENMTSDNLRWIIDGEPWTIEVEESGRSHRFRIVPG